MALHEGLRDGFEAWSAWREGVPDPALVVFDIVVILVVGSLLVRLLRFATERLMPVATAGDKTLRTFFLHSVGTAAWLVIVLVVLNRLGIQLAALLGGVAIGGFVLGFALKDALANLAAGFLLLVNRPFGVGDHVVLAGQEGRVLHIGMALTAIDTLDGAHLTIPNNQVLGAAIVNHSRFPARRIALDVGIHSSDPVDEAVSGLLEAAGGVDAVLETPVPRVVVQELTSEGPILRLFVWVKNADFLDAQNDIRRAAKRALDARGLRTNTALVEVDVKERQAG
ncbi:MAG: mechanosensitive ion channel family protein [Euryarchaeota archaeon]|nr:mechanosensitive ion channel family protein [Euryarchaeota archaeon]